MSYQLHKHQQNAVDVSIQNNFRSGTRAHTTGSGKSRVAEGVMDITDI